ncbi:MAG: oligosaccharide flippase family protein, partial [Clostridia bacterium]|nr:oligosaccharide flippase family protein [Clostridia bacterium]
RVLGTDIGLYQMVFSAYSLLVVLISSGVPLAISKLVSSVKTEKRQQKILYGAIAIMLTASGVLAIILTLGSKGLALLQGDKRIWLCYVILAPSLVFSAVSAILRGYQQGKKDFRVPALANIYEQVTRVVVGLVLMIVLRKMFVIGALLGAMIGSLVGDVVAFIFLKIASKTKLRYNINNIKAGKQIFKHSYLIMAYSLIIPFSNFVDSFLVVKLLSLHLPSKTATLLYGLQSGAVGSLISIPSIFSFALISVLMPRLSEDYANRDMEKFGKKTRLAFKLILFIALPCMILFAINSGKIINLLYGSTINGFGVNGQYVARKLLIISSIGVVFASINQLSAIILQNLNKKGVPIINLIIGVTCRLIIELMFIPSRRMGIYAYSISIIVGFVISAVLNLYAIERCGCDVFEIEYLTKQFGLGVVVLGLFTIFKLINSTSVFILGLIFVVIIYLVVAYLIKLFKKEDINLIINSE